MIIAIDGPAASGKSTSAKLLAKKLGYLYLDTGAMYRCIAFSILENKIDISNQNSLA
ncbi:MAG: (d)CMP kinase, partial [Candidatus Neomarinimicrobiota bacterium]|nr:(d)CMP kinase [Candidatus Neomarinimicrobiota bacterium]MED5248281.1 (d)CMP kinase [Candidatus Neomarinimicrobiota bacterium]